MYEPRTYRHWIKDNNLFSFNVIVKETDLFIRATIDLERVALELVKKYRKIIEEYIEQQPDFRIALEPVCIESNAPDIIKAMADAAAITGTGPMAGVAGAISEFVGQGLMCFSPEVIVENGGDIFLKTLKKRVIGIYAGTSPFTGKVGLEIEGTCRPFGICTSSGTVGHSLSFGKADAVIVLSESATLADTAATAIGNLVKAPGDIDKGIDMAKNITGIEGLVIITGSKVGAWGNVKLCHLAKQ